LIGAGVWDAAEFLEPWRWREQEFVPRVPEHFVYQPSLKMCFLLADAAHLSEITTRETPYLNELTESIRCEGLREPLEFWYNGEGGVKLKDGHHRLLAVDRLGYETVAAHVFYRPHVTRGMVKLIPTDFLPVVQSYLVAAFKVELS
jgi:hypothetical protein